MESIGGFGPEHPRIEPISKSAETPPGPRKRVFSEAPKPLEHPPIDSSDDHPPEDLDQAADLPEHTIYDKSGRLHKTDFDALPRIDTEI